MSSVFDPNKQDQDNQEQQGAQGGPLSVAVGQSSNAAGSQQQGQTPGGLAQRKASGSGRFVNIQNYLKANKQGAENLGTGVEQNVGQVKAQGQQQLDKQNKEFQGQIGGLQNQLGQTTQSVQQTAPSLANRNVSDEQFNTAFSNLKNAQQLGNSAQVPTGLSDVGAINQKVQELQTLGDLTKTDSGRQALLQRTYKRPNYTTGQVNLDNLLLGVSQGGKEALNRIQQQAPALGENVNAAQQQAGQAVQGTQANLDALKALVQGQGTEAVSGLQSDLEERLKQAAANESKRSALNAYDNSAGNLQLGTNFKATNGSDFYKNYNFAAGLTPAQARQLGALNYNATINPNDLQNDVIKNQLLGRVDPTEAGRYNQLAGLLGQQSNIPVGQQLKQGSYTLNKDTVNTNYNNAVNDTIFNTQMADPVFGGNKPVSAILGNIERVLKDPRTSPEKAKQYMADRDKVVNQVKQTALNKILGTNTPTTAPTLEQQNPNAPIYKLF